MLKTCKLENKINQPLHEISDNNKNYYQEYCRLFVANVALSSQLKDLTVEKRRLTEELTNLEQRQSNLLSDSKIEQDKKRRFRRPAGDIDRHYRCPIMSCQKSYGSEGSLNQHIKIKHPQYYQEFIYQEDEDKLDKL